MRPRPRRYGDTHPLEPLRNLGMLLPIVTCHDLHICSWWRQGQWVAQDRAGRQTVQVDSRQIFKETPQN